MQASDRGTQGNISDLHSTCDTVRLLLVFGKGSPPVFAVPRFSVSFLHWGNKTLVFRTATQQAFSKARYGPIISTVLVLGTE